MDERVSTSHPLEWFPSQFAKFAVHAATRHALPEHVGDALGSEQALPQPPQLFVSVARSTQLPPQDVRPTGQAHMLAWQVRPLVHTLPHVPQFALSVRRSRSQPFAALPSQLPKPVLQVRPQVEAIQVAMAFARAGQALLQVPQCAGFDVVFTQLPPQEVGVGPAHVTPQALAEQRSPGAQALSQVPQCDADTRVSVSQPFAALPSQSPKPATQAERQAPIKQLGVLFARDGHDASVPLSSTAPSQSLSAPSQVSTVGRTSPAHELHVPIAHVRLPATHWPTPRVEIGPP